MFAAYNAYAAAKEVAVYAYNGHDGGDPYQRRRQLDFLDVLRS